MRKQNKNFSEEFIFRVKNFFDEQKIDLKNKTIGMAVSGGADSVALFISLAELAKLYGARIFVINVNHNIREKNESARDSFFVKTLVRDLKKNNFPIDAHFAILKIGEVARVSEMRKCGTEEAARFLRYEIFKKIFRKKKLDFICTAHTKNDNLETILMRFFQGSAHLLIQKKRDIFLRPLLDFSRDEIEKFLNEKKIMWCEDKTNSDTKFLRNKIRKKIIPFLKNEIPDFEKPILRFAEKIESANEIVETLSEKISIDKKNDCVFFSRKKFASAKKIVQEKIISRALILLESDARLPHNFFDALCNASHSRNVFKTNAKNIFARIENEKIILEKKTRASFREAKKIENEFCILVEKSEIVDLPIGNVSVKKIRETILLELKNTNEKIEIENFSFPFFIRTKKLGDKIEMKSGELKNVSDIFSNWKVSLEERKVLPLIQEVSGEKKIRAIWGSVFGYANWIVKRR